MNACLSVSVEDRGQYQTFLNHSPLSFFKILLYINFYILYIYNYMDMYTQTSIHPPGAGVTSGCKSSNMGSGNQIRAVWKGSFPP